MGELIQQTPIHDVHNPDLLNLMPPNLKSLIEIGCSSGALAREYKSYTLTVIILVLILIAVIWRGQKPSVMVLKRMT